MVAVIGRRQVMLGGLALVLPGTVHAATPALPIPPGNRLAFEVMRNGSKIGSHVLDFTLAGDRLDVRIKVDLAVGIGPLTLFRYSHRAVETWVRGQVASVNAMTDHDGTKHRLAMTRRAGGLWVVGDRGSYLAPPETLPASHWNRHMLDGPMVNTETGALMHPEIADHGVETVKTTTTSLLANHFSLRGDVSLETWYDPSPRWVGLSFAGTDGSTIRYLLAGS